MLWFRRDLRLADHPALLTAQQAAGSDGAVLPVFVFDGRLWGPSVDHAHERLVALDRYNRVRGR